MWVDRATWARTGAPEVTVYSIHNGGHTIPQAKYRTRWILGLTARDIDGMEQIEAMLTHRVQHTLGTGTAATWAWDQGPANRDGE